MGKKIIPGSDARDFYIIFKMTFEVLYEKSPYYSPTLFDDIRFLQ